MLEKRYKSLSARAYGYQIWTATLIKNTKQVQTNLKGAVIMVRLCNLKKKILNPCPKIVVTKVT